MTRTQYELDIKNANRYLSDLLKWTKEFDNLMTKHSQPEKPDPKDYGIEHIFKED